MEAPKPGVTHDCEIVSLTDGDTLVVKTTSIFSVRLLDCYAPEVHGAEKPEGLASKAHLEQLCKPGTKAVIQIPFSDRNKFSDISTLGRVLGRVWVNGVDVGRFQVDAGHAKATQAAK